MNSKHPTPHRFPTTTALAISILLALACTQTEPFDSIEHLRSELSERLGAEPAARLELPFELPAEKLAEVEDHIGLRGSAADRVRATEDFIFRRLGLVYALGPTRNALDVLSTAQGNCLSFAHLFVALTRHQRINSFYVEVTDRHSWSYHQGMVLSQGHIVAGHYLDGHLELSDFLPGRPRSYHKFQPIDDLTATVHHYNNLGAEALLAGDATLAEQHLRTAVELAPGFVRGLSNLGLALTRQQRYREAGEVFQKGLGEEPDDAALLSNLALTYQLQGRTTEADELLATIETLQQASPFFFIYQGERALAASDLGNALGLMRQALRRSSEIPAVHVGLAKVYLALGELHSAGHHLRRALRLDPSHEAAQHWAELLAKHRGKRKGGE